MLAKWFCLIMSDGYNCTYSYLQTLVVQLNFSHIWWCRKKKIICNNFCWKSWQNRLHFISCARVSTSDVIPDVRDCVDGKKRQKKKNSNHYSPLCCWKPTVSSEVTLSTALWMFWRGSRCPLHKIKGHLFQNVFKICFKTEWHLLKTLKTPQDSHVTPVFDD